MKVNGSIFLSLVLSLGLVHPAHSGRFDSHLLEELQQKSADELVRVWIEVKTDHSAAALKTRVVASGATRAERHALALTALHRQSQTQKDILVGLENLQKQKRAEHVKGHWIVNIIEAEVSAGELQNLAARSDVETIYLEPKIELIAPTATGTPEAAPADATGSESNLQHIRAPEAWDAGYTGAGRLICSFDTGVNGLHPALLSRWKGHDGDSTAAWYDPVYEQSFPHAVTDIGGIVPSHGTHTMGIMVGADPETYDTVGVAPGAKWISAAVIDIPGASILDAFEWAADPDGDPNTVSDVPDVINHSWGFKDIRCLDVFYTAIDHTEALGIVNIFSAGNEGSAANAIRNPANRALDSLDCFAVGNLNHATDVIAGNSSRGPSPCDDQSIKPNVVAPGSTIRSTWYNITTRYSALSGTSQAAPHVSGLVALLRQKNPNATVDEIKTAILTSTRRSGAWGEMPSNLYGWGEIDCMAALDELSSNNTLPNLRVYDFDHLSITPGDTVRGTVILQNLGAPASDVSGSLLDNNGALTILDGNLWFGTIGEGDTVRSVDSVTVVVSDTTTMGSILSTDFVVIGSSVNDTVRLHFLLGTQPGKSVATHTGSRIEFTVSDYGVFGMASGSMFPLHGAGFTFDGDGNDLWEGGIMIGTGYSQVSSAVHSYLFDPDMDFKAVPGGEMELIVPGIRAAQQTYAMFDDRRARNPIGLQITQESFLYDAPNDDFVILRYVLQNRSGGSLSNLHFGLFMDFDITNYLSNAGGYESDGEFVWMAYNNYLDEMSRFRGVKLIEGPLAAAGAIGFDAYYHWPPGGGSLLADGLSTDEKFNALTSGFIYADTNKTARDDIFIVVSAGLLTLSPDQFDTVTFAIIAGNSLADLTDAAERAALILSDVDEPGADHLLPAAFTLHQNYPNPFNPSTVISFDLPRRSKYRLEIINILGQTLYETEDVASAGRVDVAWNGEGYASGTYLYRLTVGDRAEARKMMLLK